jgi:glycosyltransferase involved in cell wall biosynthesis
MRILTISNLYPRPDRPTLGVFNDQLFAGMAKLADVRNICLVPEWRTWRWQSVRKWKAPRTSTVPTRYLPVFYAPIVGRDLAADWYAKALAREAGELRDAGAVLAAWLYPDGVAATVAARESGAPAWVLVQGSDTFHLSTRARRRVILDAAESAAGFFCVCGMLAKRLVDAGVPSAKVHVTPNGVDASRFLPSTRDQGESVIARAVPGAFNGAARKRVLFVGNLERVKGPDLALTAFEGLLRGAGRTAAQMVFVGDGAMRKRLQADVFRRRLDDCVQFAGRRPHDEIRHWMNAADVLLLSSRGEGMPNVVLEALACGLPVAATDVGACREMLAGEECARVVPAGDVPAMAAALGDVLRMACDRQALAARHRGRTWADMAREMVHAMAAGPGVRGCEHGEYR